AAKELGATFALVPTSTAVPAPVRVGVDVDAARADYIDGELGRCLERLPRALVPRLVDVGAKEDVARLLLWRAACLFAWGGRDRAAREAALLAAMDLAVRKEVEETSPEVAALFAHAAKARPPSASLAIMTKPPADAEARLDGDKACKPPCAFELPAGEHVVAI